MESNLPYGSEIRTDYRTGGKCVIVPGRQNRPKEVEEEDDASTDLSKCPFEPNTVDRKNLEIMHTGDNPWEIMVIRNKFPELSGETPLSSRDGILAYTSGYGYNEVVIETPEHNVKLEDFDDDRIKRWIDILIEREEALYSRNYIAGVMVFKNFGAAAGASIAHSHTQIIAWPELVGTQKVELETIHKSKRETGKCIYEKAVEEEKARTMIEGKNFVTIAPFASRIAGESMIVPKRHVNYMLDLTDEERYELASTLKSIIIINKRIFGQQPYNIVFHEIKNERDFHFHVEVYPRLAKLAGIELGQNVFVNTVVPEDYAAEFKQNIVELSG